MAALWDVAPCSLVEVLYTDVSAVRTSSVISAMMEAVRTSETSVFFNETARLYIPQGCHVHTRRRENLKSFLLLFTSFKVEAQRLVPTMSKRHLSSPFCRSSEMSVVTILK
jgi:hypothetical protein